MYFIYRILFLIFFFDWGYVSDVWSFSDSTALILRPSSMFIKSQKSVEEASSYDKKFVDARDLPEMMEILLERNRHDHADVQAVVLDSIDGVDNVAFRILYESFLAKCPNLRFVSLKDHNCARITKDVAATLCKLMRCSPRCVIDLSETEIRNKDVFPLLEEMQCLTGVDYRLFEQRLIYLRKNYLWDAQNRVSCYKEKANMGLLGVDWVQRHKDFHSYPNGLGPSTKGVVEVDLPYPINLVFGAYETHTSSKQEALIASRFSKLSLNTADHSDDEEHSLAECSSVDSYYLSRHMVDKYGHNLENVRYIWLEDSGIDADVLKHLYEGFLRRCNSLRVLSFAGNSIGVEVVSELIQIWKTSPDCMFVLANTTFGGTQSGRDLFAGMRKFLPNDEEYSIAVQKIILMDESELGLSSYLNNGTTWAEEKLWDIGWETRHIKFWQTYASKRDRIPESLVSQDACE